MANEVKLPRLGQGMEAGTVTKWLKSPGEKVEKGEPLFEIDTDKVTQEVESDFSGVLLKIALPEGEAPVGQTIAWIGAQGEELQAPAPSEPQTREPRSAEPNQVRAPEPGLGEPNQIREVPSSNGADSRIKASPLARRIARERGIDLSSL